MLEPRLLEADDLVGQLLGCSDDPLAFVKLAFPDIRPEKWQREVLEHIGNTLQDNARLDRWKAVQIAVASGNGVGKSALLAWTILWALITFEDTIGVVTAGTEGQLRTRLWSELSKWHSKLPEGLRAQFELTATAIFNKQAEKTYRVDGRPWTERNKEAFSGVHNYRKRVIVVFDECSMIPDTIWDATSGMLSDAETEIIWCVFGNPTRNFGRFPMLFPPGKFAGLWKHFRVNSCDVTLTDKAAIEERLSYYGPQSNWARSHVLGLFPLATATQLIPIDVVEAAAVRRDALAHFTDPVILGADVASGHGTDVSVVAIRKGLDARSYGIRKFPGLDPIAFSYQVAAIANEVSADGIFIDSGGVGEGTTARLRELGLPAHGIHFGSKSDYPDGVTRTANKRSEMWCRMGQWLKVGAIVNDDELKAQICAPEHGENAMGLVLEKKEHMRERGLASPDCADALALTFAYPVHTAAMSDLVGPGDQKALCEYNPFSDAAMEGRPLPEAKPRYTVPGYRLKPEWNHPDWTGDDWADAQASDALSYARGETDD
jgi:hypothetical protein